MEESAKENAKLNSLPLPHTCFSVNSAIVPKDSRKDRVSNYSFSKQLIINYLYVNERNTRTLCIIVNFKFQITNDNITTKHNSSVTYFVNILAWVRVPPTSKPSKARGNTIAPR